MDRRKLRIIFCGEDGFSSVVLKSLIDAGHKVVGTIIPEYSNNAHLKLVKMCSDYGIPFIREKNINSDKVVEWTESKQPEIGVSSHFTKIIKHDLLSIPSMGFINLHPSPLPYYRGATPQHWQIVNGERESAVTVHFINDGVDTGDIIVQRKIEIASTDYVSDLQKKWLSIYPSIVVDAIDRVIAGIKPTKQLDIATRYYGLLKPEDMILSDNMSSAELYGRVKAFSLPYAGACYGKTIIYRAEVISDPGEDVLSLPVGIHRLKDNIIILRAKDGALRILKAKELKN